jgi:hypothetical protein
MSYAIKSNTKDCGSRPTQAELRAVADDLLDRIEESKQTAREPVDSPPLVLTEADLLPPEGDAPMQNDWELESLASASQFGFDDAPIPSPPDSNPVNEPLSKLPDPPHEPVAESQIPEPPGESPPELPGAGSSSGPSKSSGLKRGRQYEPDSDSEYERDLVDALSIVQAMRNRC